MVKVIELSADERAKGERTSRLKDIAQKIIPKESLITSCGYDFVISEYLSVY